MFNILETRGCHAFTSDLKVKAGNNVFYPDLTIACGEPMISILQPDILENPLMIVEVLSPSTEVRDRGYKFRQYAKIGSLKEIVLISQTEPLIEVFTRVNGSTSWNLSEYEGLGSKARLASIESEIGLTDIYKRTSFPQADPPTEPPPSV